MTTALVVGITIFWAAIFVGLAYIAALILFAVFRRGVIRGLGILPVYLGLCAILLMMPFSLATGVGLLIGSVPGIILGLILIFVLLGRWDKQLH